MTQTIQNWHKVKLSDLGSVARGRSRHRPRNDASLYGGEYPFIQTSDVKNANLYIDSYSQTYNEKGLAQSKLWEPDTLCITIAANIAESGILKIPACFPDSIVGFRSDKGVSDVRFVKYLLDVLKENFQRISRGTTQDNLSLEKLLSIDFLTPAFHDQEKIADILATHDILIENNARRIHILEQIAQAIYKEWFVKTDDKIPKGWKIANLGTILDIKSGYTFKSKSYSSAGLFKIVTIKNIHDGRFVSDFNFVTEVPKNMPDHCKLNDGDILISLTGNVGRVCIVYGENLLLNQRVGKIVPKDLVYKSFIYLLLRSENFKKQLELLSNGVAQQNLSPVQTLGLKIVLPPISLIADFENIVGELISLAMNLNKQNDSLAQSRDLLLPKLVTGEIKI